MIYDIRHVTRFDYGASVKFARCNLRLKPIHWSGQELRDYRLSISPSGRTAPARAEAGLANVMRLVVEEPVRHLVIESVSRIAIDRPVPMPSDSDPTLAEIAIAARASRDASPAGPANYLFPSPLIPLDRDIAEWCAQDLRPDRPSLDAAIALARRIQNEFAFDPEATLVDTVPHEAFKKRGGVCQDFAQIMITGLRAAGLPAAYASGYIRTIPPPGQPRLVGAMRLMPGCCCGAVPISAGSASTRPTASGWPATISSWRSAAIMARSHRSTAWCSVQVRRR